MCYNPPFCYALDSFLTNNDTVEHLVLGLGNGGIARYRKNGLKLEEYSDMVHRAQINAICIDRSSEILFTCSADRTFGIHSMNTSAAKTLAFQMNLLSVDLEGVKPNDITASKFK